jgi:hypothetical protein
MECLINGKRKMHLIQIMRMMEISSGEGWVYDVRKIFE